MNFLILQFYFWNSVHYSCFWVRFSTEKSCLWDSDYMLNLTDFLFLFADLTTVDSLLFLKLSDMLFCKTLELTWDLLVHEVIADWQMTHDNDEWDLYSVDSDNSNDSDLIFVILTNLTCCQQFWWSEFNKSDDFDEKMLELCKRASFNSYDSLCSKILAWREKKRKEKKLQMWSFRVLYLYCVSITWSVSV